MKLLKYFLIFIFIICLGITTWIYYPQYQIEKLKKQAVKINNHHSKLSYMDYFRNTEKTQHYHLAIGDSIIRGFGAQKNEDLVYQFSNKLEKQIDKDINYQNKGINGITSNELNKLVQQGQFDEDIKKSDIITINVGGNDILRTARGKALSNALQTFDQLQSSFAKNLSDITTHIKKLNPEVTIVLLELYNPLSIDFEFYALADQLLPTWNLKIYEIANQHRNSLVIETTKVINGENLQNLSADGVHPNSAGYMAISEQMIEQLKKQYKQESV